MGHEANELAALTQIHDALLKVSNDLARSERLCQAIAELSLEEADRARQDLSDARRDFTDVRLRFVQSLDVLSVRNQQAEQARRVLSERYRYPSGTAAEGLLGLTAALLRGREAPESIQPRTLAEELAAAMRVRGDNKKSAAGRMAISPKTLDRLLRGEPTTPVKQQAARRYIEQAADSK